MSGRIIIIDDEERYASMLCDLLVGHGYQAEMETDPQVALERIFSQSFDLVVTDYKMPAMDGSELLKAVHDRLPNLPVIIVSGLMNMPELIKVANIGVTLVMEKPFDTQDFLDNVAKFVDLADDEGGSSDAAVEENSLDGDAEAMAAIEETNWSFPQPTHEFAGQSREAKELLEALHKNWSLHRHFLVNCSDDSERTRLLQELVRWENSQGVDQANQISLFELGMQSSVEQLVTSLQRSGNKVVLVLVPPAQPDLAVQFSSWWKFLNQFDEVFSEVRFLYVANYKDKWDLSVLQNLAGEDSLILREVLTLPPLAGRLEDLAFYVHSFVDGLSESDANMSAEAIDFILKYPWDRGLNQLTSFLTLYFRELTPGERLEGSLPIGYSNLEGSALASYLQRKQALYLENQYNPSEGMESFLSQLGLLELGASAKTSLADQPLLYPELAAGD